MVVAWLPLTAHCQLENITGLEILRCEPMAASATSGHSHCDDVSCNNLESGQYQLPPSQPQAAVPLFAVISPVLVPVESGLLTGLKSGAPMRAPPKPSKPWQFFLRTALPVRAPSFAS
jgi:hypothetical protein